MKPKHDIKEQKITIRAGAKMFPFEGGQTFPFDGTKGVPRTHATDLQAKAWRLIDSAGNPIDSLWRFSWVGKAYVVEETEIR